MAVAYIISVIALGLAASVSCSMQCGQQMDADVLILGAGIAGLGAAETLSESGIDNFLIIDQLDRIGGRVRSEKFAGGLVELGPQFAVAVDLTAPEQVQNPLIPLMNRCNITLRPIPLGSLPVITYNNRGENVTQLVQDATGRLLAAMNVNTVRNILGNLPEGFDIPTSQGLRTGGWFPTNAIEEHTDYLFSDLLYSMPSDALGYRHRMESAPQAQIRFGPSQENYAVINPEGYAAFSQCVADEFLSDDDPRLILETVIEGVEWGDNCVCATSSDQRKYCARYAIITFSVAHLQNGHVNFTPQLSTKKHLTLNQFELRNYLKIFISFAETFWDTGVDFITYVDEINGREYYPTFIPWGSFFPDQPPILEAILTGKTAKRIAYQDPNITQQQIADVMSNIYGERASGPVDIVMSDFIINPFFLGDFSAPATGLTFRQFDEINAPCGNLYFSGEAYDPLHYGTFHAALIHGRETAARIVQRLQGPLKVIFINNTPRVDGNNITAEFITSKPATTIECVIKPRAPRQNCSFGRMTFSDLDDGSYQLRVIARIEEQEMESEEEEEEVERGIASRSLTVSSGAACAVHFINAGVSISGRRAVVEFSSSGLPVSEFMCTHDNGAPKICSSPFILRQLPTGRHRIRIDPVCEGAPTRRVAIFTIDAPKTNRQSNVLYL